MTYCIKSSRLSSGNTTFAIFSRSSSRESSRLLFILRLRRPPPAALLVMLVLDSDLAMEAP